MTSHGQTQPLTPAETRVAQLVARALKNREIADELGVSEATVGVHLGHVYKKLGLRSRTELVLRLASGKEEDEVAHDAAGSRSRRGRGGRCSHSLQPTHGWPTPAVLPIRTVIGRPRS